MRATHVQEMACNLLAAMIVGDIYAAKPFHPLGNHDCRDQQALVGQGRNTAKSAPLGKRTGL